jgi:hypothetical protein
VDGLIQDFIYVASAAVQLWILRSLRCLERWEDEVTEENNKPRRRVGTLGFHRRREIENISLQKRSSKDLHQCVHPRWNSFNNQLCQGPTEIATRSVKSTFSHERLDQAGAFMYELTTYCVRVPIPRPMVVQESFHSKMQQLCQQS